MTPPVALYITPELHRRVPKVVDFLGEKLALQDIGAQMLDHPDRLLPKLVDRAMQMTGAKSAGISAFEPEDDTPGHFRWRDLRGELARFEGATTPRNYSPCGVCLDRFEPTLTRRPERYYSWIAEAGTVCPEVLLVPLYIANGKPLGTLWIVAEREGYFDSGHARVMQELASFVGIAIAMQQSHERLQVALAHQELLTRELDHRVNNIFQLVDTMIQIGKRSVTSTAEFADTLSGRLRALAASHSLVRQGFGKGMNVSRPTAATLHRLTDAIFKPYQQSDLQRFIVTGHDVKLGDSAITGLALVFHELATNAAKYGALSTGQGHVSVGWERQGDLLSIRWQEDNGPPIVTPPEKQGFGSTLLRNTITRRLGGNVESRWRKEGLIVVIALPILSLGN